MKIKVTMDDPRVGCVVLIASALLILLSPALLRKRTVPLVSNGKVMAFVTRPLALPWNDDEVSVFVGKEKVFRLWEDFFDFPLFIYPFADGQRFLCIEDDDTSVLVFVVDFSASATNATNVNGWPPNDYLRNYMAGRAPGVVIGTKGVVRLPMQAEVQEVSSHLAGLAPGQFKKESFPAWDIGIYRAYWPKDQLMLELSTNRSSVWPMP